MTSNARATIGRMSIVCFALLAFGFQSHAAPGDVDLSFDAGLHGNPPGIQDVPVRAIDIQADGKIVIAGDFYSVHGDNPPYLARLNADGSRDSGFVPQVIHAGEAIEIYSVAIQPDGKIIIGGFFGTVNGVTRRSIARLNPDASLDTGFQNGMTGVSNEYTGSDGFVYCLTVQPDGRVLVGGNFTSINGQTPGSPARLNPDGSVDATFQNIFPYGANVSALQLQPDGKVLIGGSGILRLHADGTRDTNFNVQLIGNGATPIDAIALQSDGKILIGGKFNSIHSAGSFFSRTNIARLNADGSVDTTFQDGLTGVSSGSGHPMRALAVQADGRIIIGGDFTAVNGANRFGIARLHRDGTLDNSFQSGMAGVSGGLNGYSFVQAMALQPDGKVLVGGAFTQVNGVVRWGMARLFGSRPLQLSNIGVLSNQIGFDVAGEPGQPVVVEASTDLVNWNPLGTFTLGETAFHFTDPAWTGFLQRFYRARMP